MTKKELAIANHDKKYNCCQAVACCQGRLIGCNYSSGNCLGHIRSLYCGSQNFSANAYCACLGDRSGYFC